MKIAVVADEVAN